MTEKGTIKQTLLGGLTVGLLLLLFSLSGCGNTKSQQEEVPQDTVKQGDVQNDETEQNPAEEQPPTEPEPVTPPEPVYTGLEMKLEILDVNADKADQCWMQIVRLRKPPCRKAKRRIFRLRRVSN